MPGASAASRAFSAGRAVRFFDHEPVLLRQVGPVFVVPVHGALVVVVAELRVADAFGCRGAAQVACRVAAVAGRPAGGADAEVGFGVLALGGVIDGEQRPVRYASPAVAAGVGHLAFDAIQVERHSWLLLLIVTAAPFERRISRA